MDSGHIEIVMTDLYYAGWSRAEIADRLRKPIEYVTEFLQGIECDGETAERPADLSDLPDSAHFYPKLLDT
jgi:hypothetical protein